MSFFGFIFVRKSEVEALRYRAKVLRENYDELKKTNKLTDTVNLQQAHQIQILKQKVDENRLEGIIDVDIGDPSPNKGDERKAYVMRVAGFHKDVLQGKIKQMISVFHKLLEDEENDQNKNHYLQVGVFICREFERWGSAMVNEALSYQVEPSPTPEERKETTALLT